MKKNNKKSAKPLIVVSLFIFAVFTSIILLYVGVKLECERVTKEKVLAQEKLNALKNWEVSLIAQKQALSSEERIVGIAENNLGMVRKGQPFKVLTVSKNEIKHVAEELKKKYEKF